MNNPFWIIVIVLIILLLLGLPNMAMSHHYGYWPSGTIGLVILILVILILAGRL